MKLKHTLLLTLATASLGLAAENNTPPEGFTALFNGKDLSGWYGWGTQDPTDLWKMTPEERAAYKKKSVEGGLKDAKGNDKGDHVNAHWKVENGELVNDGKGLYLTTDKDYGDFELWVDYKMLPLGDSGIYLRGIPQVQIWDYTEEAKFKLGADKGSGSLWNNKGEEGKFPLKRMDKPFGEWNRFHIKMIGERVTVTLNGEIVVNNAPLENYFANAKAGYKAFAKADPKAPKTEDKKPNGWFPDPAFAKGPIQLQTHGSEIRWRNVFIREISPEEAVRAYHGVLQQLNIKPARTIEDDMTLQTAIMSYGGDGKTDSSSGGSNGTGGDSGPSGTRVNRASDSAVPRTRFSNSAGFLMAASVSGPRPLTTSSAVRATHPTLLRMTASRKPVVSSTAGSGAGGMGPRSVPSGVKSNSAIPSCTAPWPSAMAWCSFEMTAALPPGSPSSTVTRHSGRSRSSRRSMTSAAHRYSAASSPGRAIRQAKTTTRWPTPI